MNILEYLKKQPLSCLEVAAIWVVCMIPVPETPLSDVAFIDKWTHFLMYGTLVAVIMAEYGHRKSVIQWRRFLIGGLLMPIVMGGLVELTQAYLTNGVRSGDWLDFVANTTGACLGAAIGIPLARVLSTRNKDC